MEYLFLITPLLIILMLLYVKTKKLNVVLLAKDLILYAEKNMKSVDGLTKLKFVCSTVQSKLPPIIRPFVKEEYVIAFIQKIFDSIYDYLEHESE